MSLPVLVILTAALLLDPSSAASGHFLAPETPLLIPVVIPVVVGKSPGSISTKDLQKEVHSLQQLNDLTSRTISGEMSLAGWLLNVTGPDGQNEVLDFPGARRLSWKQYFGEMLLGWLFWLVIALFTFLCCYRTQSPVPERKSDEVPADTAELEKMFLTGHWNCLEDSNICICSFCCPALRWADTVSLAGFLTFWGAFAVFNAVTLVSVLASGAMFGIISGFMLLYYRQQLRDKLHVESGTCGSCLRDFLYVCCCPFCAISQEARIVKRGIENNHEGFSPEHTA